MGLRNLKIVVIGGGIGGVATAIAFARKGASVVVIEQAPVLDEVGAGLQISANGMAVLKALEVVGDVPEGAVCSTGTELRDYRKGDLITSVPPPGAGPTWYFHRADLLALLVRTAQGAGVAFELGARVENVDPALGRVSVAGAKDRHFDLVIGADGGRSRARTILNGASAPVFSKQVAWRATVPWAPTGANPSAVLTMGPGCHVVTYPLRRTMLMNVVAIEERSDWTEEDWRRQGDALDLRRRFKDFGGTVGKILAKVETTHIWALYLHPVAEVWQRDRLALVGDAAHPTLPFMAQGACLALEDAWVIADCLEKSPSISKGLQNYQQTRQTRAKNVVATAAGNARKFHLKPPLSWVAQAALRSFGAKIAARNDWIYAHDVTAKTQT
jgi:salicylate hydroxylase